MRLVFREVWRVLAPTGTLWLNCGDAYSATGKSGGGRQGERWAAHGADVTGPRGGKWSPPPPGMKPKSLLGLPWRLALALQSDGWILRSEIIWHKLNPMPESVQDRPTRSHEQVFLFSKQGRYYYDGEAVREPQSPQTAHKMPYGRSQGIKGSHSPNGLIQEAATPSVLLPNGRAMRSVLSLASEPTPYAHFATFPTELVRKCLLAGAPQQVCRACNKPWVRQVETSRVPHAHPPGPNGRQNVPGQETSATSCFRTGLVPVRTTTGFFPSCTCAAPTRTARVLDIFAGSGTVGLVARELGHDAVCVDLSWQYLSTIARERLGLAALDAWRHGAAPRVETFTDLPLFAG